MSLMLLSLVLCAAGQATLGVDAQLSSMVNWEKDRLVRAIESNRKVLSQQDTDGHTLVHLAVLGSKKATQLRILSQFLNKTQVGIQDCNGLTALHFASWHGTTEQMQVLLDCGADSKCADVEGRTPLHYAALSGNCSALSLLLQRGAVVDAVDVDGLTPLWYGRGSVSVVRMLARFGAATLVRDSEGNTIAHELVRGGGLSPNWRFVGPCVRFVLERSGTPDVRNWQLVTPLMLACRNLDGDAIRALVRLGSDIKARDLNGSTPADYVEIASGPEGKKAGILRLLADRPGRT
ncbi:MAG: ankyrin repeat domain-containing protein [Armatimonadetes bacterium]|nr:ankyrin repeat domain-containing protein [Armatimonadota bacterium]